MESFLNATFLTTTAYGSWLSGDARGYVENGVMLPEARRLEGFARSHMKNGSVSFSLNERQTLLTSLVAACNEFDYRLSDAAIETTHVHWLVAHEDAIPAMAGQLKNRLRQALGRGRIWTEGYYARQISTLEKLIDARNYIAQHNGVGWYEGAPSQRK